MHSEILTTAQIELLPLVKAFKKNFYLVGGTAIALHVGHRRSIDFDLFTSQSLKRTHIKNTLGKYGFSEIEILFEDSEQLHVMITSVKMTFYHYPYAIPADIAFESIICLPELLDLTAMKAYALGRRGKWKDYVDLYVLLKDHFSLQQISTRARKIFAGLFNEKLFRQQLCYFEDIDFSETIEYIGMGVEDETIKAYLREVATSPF